MNEPATNNTLEEDDDAQQQTHTKDTGPGHINNLCSVDQQSPASSWQLIKKNGGETHTHRPTQTNGQANSSWRPRISLAQTKVKHKEAKQ